MMKKASSVKSEENSTDESVNGFEVVSSKDSLTGDKKLVEFQIHRLLRSEIIKIEEKGVLINFMHNPQLRKAMTEVL